MYNGNAGMVPSYILDLILPLVSEISDYPSRNNKKKVHLLLTGLTFHRNPVYHHPLDYGMALKMILKTYQLLQPSKTCTLSLSSTNYTFHTTLPLEIEYVYLS